MAGHERPVFCLQKSDQTDQTHLPVLDGIRGLAILLVLVSHISERFKFDGHLLGSAKKIAFAGRTGVDLFFVLSGFLITGILWDAKENTHYFRNFYARRTVRIFPIYYVTLLGIFALLPGALPLFHHLPDKVWQTAHDQIGLYQQTRHYWGWYITYLVDVLIAWKGFMMPGHFWTLAVEEHFYLVWPFLVCFLRYRALVFTSLGIIVGAFLLRAVLIPFLNPVAIYVLTPCRMDGLALGSLIALLFRAPGGGQRLSAAARVVLPVTALLWASLMFYRRGWLQYGGLAQTVGYTVTAFFYGSFLVMALSAKRIGSLVSGKALRFVGKLSYGIYIFHVFAFFLLAPLFALGDSTHYSIIHTFASHLPSAFGRRFWLALDGIAYVILAVGSSLLIALISWHLLEQPCLRLKRFFPMKQTGQETRSTPPVPAQPSAAETVL